MHLRELSITAAAALLAACGSADQENEARAAAEPQPEANEAAPANDAAEALQPVDNSARAAAPNGGSGGQAGDDRMEWSFSRAADVPKLAFGVPQTDNVRLMLRCPEPGEVLLSFLRPAEFAEGKPDMLAVVSGNSRRSLTIETEQGPLGTTVKAEAPISAAPLQQFGSGQQLEVHWGEERIRVPGAAEGPVQQFFNACG